MELTGQQIIDAIISSDAIETDGEIIIWKDDAALCIENVLDNIVDKLSFGQAIKALKKGKRVARAGWNGKGMFLFLLPASDGIPIRVITDPALRTVIESETGKDTFDALGSIRMWTSDKKVLTGWLASQTDMLSEDWLILEPPVSYEQAMSEAFRTLP